MTVSTVALPASLTTKRQRLESRLMALRAVRSSWFPIWQDISDHILPWSGRFFIGDSNLGGDRHNDIYDGSATSALRVLGAGLMAGATSPARPWFRLTTHDQSLDESYEVQTWLYEVRDRMLRVFQKSNTY